MLAAAAPRRGLAPLGKAPCHPGPPPPGGFRGVPHTQPGGMLPRKAWLAPCEVAKEGCTMPITLGTEEKLHTGRESKLELSRFGKHYFLPPPSPLLPPSCVEMKRV